MSDIELIILDVDGTLIDDHFRIQPKTKAIIRRAVRDGIIVALATGRNPGGTLPLMEELGIDGPVIVHNGAFAFDTATGKTYALEAFEHHDFLHLVDFAQHSGVHYDVNTTFHLYVDRLDVDLEKIYHSFYAKPILVRDWRELTEPVVKLSFLGEPPQVERVLPELHETFRHLRILRSGEEYIDIIHPHASKGHGLKRVADSLGIPLHKVMAIGNYYNDIDMLEVAGLSVAMANSPYDIQKVADVVTHSNNDEGIYYAIQAYVYGDRDVKERLQTGGRLALKNEDMCNDTHNNTRNNTHNDTRNDMHNDRHNQERSS
ncbi:MAG: Phosphatase YidA [Candidatus Carbobacillus altaicus]|uniref:Phosphatase YidA n=1 Tax=Candidatus Carbonibacillus altaicus TaxID=2163959 RepID=A0A2R6Y2B7_9BACL|nr:MAG: Phosphatase YidA [Candidatus Carbobacillus altaicus]